MQNVDYLTVGVSCSVNISENISGAKSPGKHNYSRHLLLCILLKVLILVDLRKECDAMITAVCNNHMTPAIDSHC